MADISDTTGLTSLSNGATSLAAIKTSMTNLNAAIAADAGGDMVLASVQTVTGAKTFGSAGAVGKLKVAGTTSGSTTLDATAVASGTVTLPAATDTLVGRATTDTLTNKSISGATNTITALPVSALADGTDGELITWNSSGVASTVAVGTAGQVLTSNGAGAAPTFQSSGFAMPYFFVSTDLSNSGRFQETVSGSGSNTFGTNGNTMATGTTNPSYIVSRFEVPAFSFTRSLQYTCGLDPVTIPASSSNGHAFFGLGTLLPSIATIDFTVEHIGFKLLSTGSSLYSLYATQANGTTETASSALTTITTSDDLNLAFSSNGSEVNYYWAKQGSAWSTATTLSTNMPTGSLDETFAVMANQSTTTNSSINLLSISLKI